MHGVNLDFGLSTKLDVRAGWNKLKRGVMNGEADGISQLPHPITNMTGCACIGSTRG